MLKSLEPQSSLPVLPSVSVPEPVPAPAPPAPSAVKDATPEPEIRGYSNVSNARTESLSKVQPVQSTSNPTVERIEDMLKRSGLRRIHKRMLYYHNPIKFPLTIVQTCPVSLLQHTCQFVRL